MNLDNFGAPISIKSGVSSNQIREVVELFDEAFAAKFSSAIPEPSLRKEFWSQVIIPAQVTVAERGGEILGLALTSFPERPGFSKDASSKLFQVLGISGGFRAAFIFMLFSKLDWKPEPRTCYLEALCVSSKARGLGLGTHMLESLSSIAKSEGLGRITLKVTLENSAARKLYLRLGFVITNTSRYRLLKLFTGTEGADTMTLALTSE